MNNEKTCNGCGDNHLIVYNEAVRNGTDVEYRSIGLCTLCGSMVEL